jgi:hypothetical protein
MALVGEALSLSSLGYLVLARNEFARRAKEGLEGCGESFASLSCYNAERSLELS